MNKTSNILKVNYTELETMVELRDQKINELNEQIKQLKSNIVSGVNND